MKKKFFFILFFILFKVLIGSVQTLDSSNKNSSTIMDTSLNFDIYSKKSYSPIQKEKGITTKNKNLSPEEKQRNFLMRTGFLILGTFIFLFVLFLVFRMKKK